VSVKRGGRSCSTESFVSTLGVGGKKERRKEELKRENQKGSGRGKDDGKRVAACPYIQTPGKAATPKRGSIPGRAFLGKKGR